MIYKQKIKTNPGTFLKRAYPVSVIFSCAILMLFITALTGCDNGADEPLNGEETQNGEVSLSEGVVATVNGEEISAEDYEQALGQEKMQLQMQGVNFESPEMADALEQLEMQVLENYFIIPTLLNQKAEEEGIIVEDEDIEERYRQYTDTFGGEEALLEQMEAVGLSRAELDRDIKRELTIQFYMDQYLEAYLEENPAERIAKEEIVVDPAEVEGHVQQLLGDYGQLKELLESDDPEIPREQVEHYFEQIEAQYGDLLERGNADEIMPVVEAELKEFKAEQMKEEKVQRVFLEHIEELRESAIIEIAI